LGTPDADTFKTFHKRKHRERKVDVRTSGRKKEGGEPVHGREEHPKPGKGQKKKGDQAPAKRVNRKKVVAVKRGRRKKLVRKAERKLTSKVGGGGQSTTPRKKKGKRESARPLAVNRVRSWSRRKKSTNQQKKKNIVKPTDSLSKGKLADFSVGLEEKRGHPMASQCDSENGGKNGARWPCKIREKKRKKEVWRHRRAHEWERNCFQKTRKGSALKTQGKTGGGKPCPNRETRCTLLEGGKIGSYVRKE